MGVPDSEAVLAILDPYFEAARELYMEFCEAHGLDTKGIEKVRLECRQEMHDTPRHFAGATEDGRIIAVAPEIVELPEDTVAAILAHEMGHTTDFLNPARFICDVDGGRLIWLPEEPGDRGERTRVARMRQWEARDEHCVELTADLIAQAVIGKPIGYSGPCLLQGFARGVARPKWLR